MTDAINSPSSVGFVTVGLESVITPLQTSPISEHAATQLRPVPVVAIGKISFVVK